MTARRAPPERERRLEVEGRQRRLLLDRAAIATAAMAASSFAGRPLKGLAAGNDARPLFRQTAREDLAEAEIGVEPSALAPASDDRPFWFGFIGDTPYSQKEEGALRQILGVLAAEPLEFVLHVGDIKSRLENCSDNLLSSRLRLLDQSPHPMILTPGDNEWTDCGALQAAWEPGGRLDRLEWLRGHAFSLPRSLGRRRMLMEQQGPYRPAEVETGRQPGRSPVAPRLPENQRWRVGSLQFCTLHVVGSNNAAVDGPELAEAWLMRQEANGDWLDDTVRLAIRERASGLVIALHANMRFEANRSDGWERMRGLVIAAAVAFDGPVLLLHGDSHHFRVDRLLQRSHGLANLQRVECFGSPFSSSWVQIRWDPASARPGAGTASDPFQVSTRSLP